MKVNFQRLKKCKNVYCKGFVIYENSVYKDDEICNLIEENESFSTLKNKLHKFNGNFTIYWEDCGKYWVVTDHLNSIPIFYNESFICDSNDQIKIRTLNGFDYIHYQLSGVTPGEKTKSDLISSLPSQIICIDNGNVRKECYSDFFTSSAIRWNKEKVNWEVAFGKVNEKIVSKLKVISKKKQIIVPLSGGYDSRLVLHLLKRAEVENVLCFTYGEKREREVAISKAVAESFGYKWKFIEYTSSKWKELKKDRDYIDFCSRASSLNSVVHFQDFMAVKELLDIGIKPQDSLFIPGHAMDFLAGNHIPKICFTSERIFINDLVNYIINRHYSLRAKTRDETQVISDYIKKQIFNYTGSTDELIDSNKAISLYMNYNFKERQSKFILCSLRIYDYFDCNWFLPLWDKEYIKFFEECDKSLLSDRYVSIEWDVRNIKPRFNSQEKELIYDEKQVKPSKSELFLNVRKVLQSTGIYNFVLFFVLLKKVFVENTFGWFSLYSVPKKFWGCLKGYKEVYAFEANSEFKKNGK